MIAYYRHVHTGYEDELRKISSKRYSQYLELREGCFDFETAWMIVDEELEGGRPGGRMKLWFAL